MEKRPFFRSIMPMVVSFLVIGGMALFVRHFSERLIPQRFDRYTIENLPEVPDLSAWPEVFAERLQRAYEGLADRGRQIGSLTDLARLYHANGFLAPAQSCYLGLANLQPEEGEWPYMLAMTRQDYADWETVSALLERSLELDPGYSFAYLELGNVYGRAGQWELAAEAYQRRLEAAPSDGWAMAGMGQVAMARGDWEAAEEWLLVAADTEEARRLAVELLPEVYQELGNVEAAKRFRARAADLAGPVEPFGPRMEALMAYCFDPYRLLTRAEAEMAVGDWEAARVLLERAIWLRPSDVEARSALAEFYARSEAPQRALYSYSRAIGQDRLSAEAVLEMTELLVADDRTERALAVLDAGTAEFPRSATLQVRQGELLEDMGRLGEAEAAYRAAVQQAGAPSAARRNLGMLLAEAGSAEAVEQLRRYLTNEPQDANAWLALAAVLERHGESDAASEALQRAREANAN